MSVRHLAYADPPYLGCCARYGHFHPDGLCWDDPETHHLLVERLNREFDGWALSMKSDPTEKAQMVAFALPGLKGRQLREGTWVKPFAVFRPNVNPAFASEPVLFCGPRKKARYEPTVRDFHSENITLKKGLVGAKPPGFNRWVLDFLGYRPGLDTFTDLYPGTGGMAVAVQAFSNGASPKEGQ